METLEKQLQTIGFDEKEAKIYLTCMQLGKDTAFNIAKRAEIKRSTAYFILNNLIEKGVINTHKTKKVLLYYATNPKKLVTQIEHKMKTLDMALPSLLALYNEKEDKPNIQIYEVETGVTQIYQEIIESLKKKKSVDFFGTVAPLEKYPDLLEMWFQETKNKGYHIRELLNNDDLHRRYRDRAKTNNNPNHHIKLLSKDLSPFTNDNAILGNKLIIFSTAKNLFVTVIESKEIVNSYKILFESLWGQSKGK